MTHIDTALLIGADFQPGQEAPEPILNPRTGALILNVPEDSTAQDDADVEAYIKEFDRWRLYGVWLAFFDGVFTLW